jgi:hypothetical protein
MFFAVLDVYEIPSEKVTTSASSRPYETPSEPYHYMLYKMPRH